MSESRAVRALLLPVIVLLVVAGLPRVGHAHAASTGFIALDLTEDAARLRVDIALRDLDTAIGLDGNADGALTWGELMAREDAMAAYVAARLILVDTANRDCDLLARHLSLADRIDGTYAVFDHRVTCPGGHPAALAYTLLFDLDANHRGLMRVDNAAGQQDFVLRPGDHEAVLDSSATTGTGTFARFWREGVHHIWIGVDHIFFIATLLMAAALQRADGRWQPRAGWRPVLRDAVAVVTAFTVAHSITLSLSVLGIVALPIRLVESVIAATVVVAALNNLYPLLPGKRWLIAFVLGLIHGFGFAAVLAEIGLAGADRLVALAAFNLGVESGQLVIVAGLLPVLYLLRDSHWYRRWALPAASAAIAAIGLVWLAERGLDLELVVF